MSADFGFTKENIDYYLNNLALEYRKKSGRHVQKAEIILVGGSSVVINYNFRNSTIDIDGYYVSSYAMKDAITSVQEKMQLADDWFNSDFTRTDSFSPKIRQYSKFYKSFANVLDVRTINAEYLVAMKLVAARRYKHDCSDIIGILNEQQCIGKPLSFEKIDKAVVELYNNWDYVDEYAKELLESALKENNLGSLYMKVQAMEKKAYGIVSSAGRVNEISAKTNIDELINAALYRSSSLTEYDMNDYHDEYER